MTSGDDPQAGGGASPTLAEAVAALAAALAAATAQASAQVPEPARASRPGAAVGAMLKGLAQALLPSVVMFALGYVFIQGVELDLKREQFTASAADKLRHYVEVLMPGEEEVPVARLQSVALALGGFGGVAAYPLVSIIEHGGAQRIDAAKAGLEQAGRVAPAASCPVIASVVADTTRAYQWQTRKAVAEVAGYVGCAEAKEPLQALSVRIASMTELTAEQRKNFEAAVGEALARVEAAGRRQPW